MIHMYCKYHNNKIIISCYVDDMLLCYDGGNNLPMEFVAELNKNLTAVKLDTANPLVHVGNNENINWLCRHDDAIRK